MKPNPPTPLCRSKYAKERSLRRYDGLPTVDLCSNFTLNWRSMGAILDICSHFVPSQAYKRRLQPSILQKSTIVHQMAKIRLLPWMKSNIAAHHTNHAAVVLPNNKTTPVQFRTRGGYYHTTVCVLLLPNTYMRAGFTPIVTISHGAIGSVTPSDTLLANGSAGCSKIVVLYNCSVWIVA